MKKPKKKRLYDQNRVGYAGTFGSGANIDIMYLQTAFSPGSIDAIRLIEDIPGSEKWDVRDLFQRHVNQKRVQEIKDFLLSDGSVKFFNPITLVLLPYNQHTHTILPNVKHLPPQIEESDGYSIKQFENDGYFRLDLYDDPSQSELCWNQEKVLLVAIDGQHRLSAIKQIQSNPELMSKMNGEWSVPAVILVMSKSNPDLEGQTILEVVRRTFININQEAAQINASRLIILDDESVNRIACQEIVNAAHKNDNTEDRSEINLTRTPLMFFDWRGEVEGNKDKPIEGSVLNLVELESLLGSYILGDDGSDEQRNVLQIDEILPPVTNFGKGKRLTAVESNAIRRQFREILLPAIQYLIEEITPFKDYIEGIRAIQFPKDHSDLADAAFKQICFGAPPVSNPTLYEDVRSKVLEMSTEFVSLKTVIFDELLTRDIGLRAIFSAFGHLKEIYDNQKQETANWLEYAKWFVERINKLIEDGWFKGFGDDSRSEDIKLLTQHIVFKPAGDIDNYKLKDVDNAFGALIAAEVSREESSEFRIGMWDKVEPKLRRPLEKGFRSEVRARLSDQPLSQADRNAKVKEETLHLTEERLKVLRARYLPELIEKAKEEDTFVRIDEE